MPDESTAFILREALWTTLLLGGPLMAAALVVGLLVALLQTLTQINEATLVFVPKIVAIFGATLLLAPFMTGVMRDFAREVFDRLVTVPVL